MELDLVNELQQVTKQLEKSVKMLRKTSEAYAVAERDYKLLLNQEILRLRDQGMAVGIIDKICYGLPSVAQKRFERDCAEGVYKANQEAINVYKLKARLLDNQGWLQRHF